MTSLFYVELYGSKSQLFEFDDYSEACEFLAEKLTTKVYAAGAVLDDIKRMMKFSECDDHLLISRGTPIRVCGVYRGVVVKCSRRPDFRYDLTLHNADDKYSPITTWVVTDNDIGLDDEYYPLDRGSQLFLRDVDID